MKQVILVREDVEMSCGKAVAQGAHASVRAVRCADDVQVQNWVSDSAETKVTLAVQSEEELRELVSTAEDATLPASLVSDLGRTEVAAGTVTAGAVGPAKDDKIDAITGHLDLYN